jgi:riboflavin kinase/FMN adenylyltransferase
VRIVRSYQGLSPEERPGAAAAIGNFDGVHRGHQSVIAAAREAALGTVAPLGVVTFEPHPREIFAPDASPFRLMNAEARAHRFEKLGVEILYEIPFDRGLAGLSPEAFVQDVIVDGLALSHVVIGTDFHFGAGRAGSAADLRAMGQRFGFGATIAPLLEFDGLDVSSTRIREALTDGRPRDAAEMLGHYHRIEGEVIRGEQRGRELGYPTANMSIAGLHPPRFGVYAVSVDVLSGPHEGRYPGVASLGVRPMFGLNTPNLETYLFDFNGDLYGTHLSVALVEFLRDEAKFDSIDALVAQMNADSARARKVVA